MTEVLFIPAQPDGSFFEVNPLRRTSSQSSLFLRGTNACSTPSSEPRSKCLSTGFENRLSTSLPSSAPSSPRLNHFGPSTQPSYTSTPSSSLSLDDQCSTAGDEDDEDILFPDYEDEQILEGSCIPVESVSVPVQAPARIESRPRSIAPRPAAKLSRPTVGCQCSTTEDDMAARREPTAHVDYLSHSWAEEDIWASWRYVISKRNTYGNSIRLENAVWRSWTKSKYQFRTIAPGRLNWEKDHDVTWLYGPLQTGPRWFQRASVRPVSRLSRNNSFASKKPILKKRSLSEMMLQHSIKSATLMQQATDSLQAQQPGRSRPILRDRTLSEFGTTSYPKRSGPNPIATPSSPGTLSSASGAQTPCTERHIHFNNKVEQCIAINKGGDDQYDYYGAFPDDSSSDDEPLTMKPVRRAQPGLSTPRNSFCGESKTIAMLPSTTLKYRGDTPDPVEQQSKQRGSFWKTPTPISPCPSQRTITPRMPSANFLLGDEDDDADLDWQPSLHRKNSLHLLRGPTLARDGEYEPDETHSAGLHRTLSGMMMPDEEDEQEVSSVSSSGLVAMVVNTVNTAKDIAHVIWNVGWRR